MQVSKSKTNASVKLKKPANLKSYHFDLTGQFSEGQMNSNWRTEDKAIIDNFTLAALFYSEDWVFILIDAIAMRLSHLPLSVYLKQAVGEKIEYRLAKNHELNSLLQNPNPYEDKTAFVYHGIVEYLLGGNNFIYNAEIARMLVHLPFHLVQYKFGSKGAPEKLYFYPSGVEENGYIATRAEPFDLKDIIHIKRPNPASVYWGLSPFIPGRRSVLFNRYSQDYLNAFYLKGASPQMALQMDVEAKSDKITRMLRTFELAHTGRKNMRRTMLLPKGVDIKTFESKIADQQLIDLVNQNRETIMNILHVPKQVLSLQESGSIGSEEHRHAMRQFWVDCVVPTGNMWCDALTHALKTKLGKDFCIRFDVSGVDFLQEDETQKIDLATKALSVMTLNEVRTKYLGLPGLPLGDRLPGTPPISAMESFVPQAEPVSPALLETGNPDQIEAPQAEVQTTPDISLNGAQITSLISVINQVAQRLMPRESAVALIQAAFSLPLDAVERIMGPVGTTFFLDPAIEIPSAIGTGKELPEVKLKTPVEIKAEEAPALSPFDEQVKAAKDIPVKLEAEQIPSKKKFAVEQLNAQQKAIQSVLKKFKSFKAKKPTKKELETAIGDTQDQYVQAYQKTFAENAKQGQQSQLSVVFQKQDRDTLEAIMAKNEDGLRTSLELRGLESFKSIADTSAERAMQVIEDGIARNDSVGKISNDLEKKFAELLEYRADTIARTETLTAVTIGQNMVVEEAKKVLPGLKKMWLTAGDDDVRDAHADMDGVTIDVDDEFDVGGEKMYGPRTGGSAGNKINCRCVLLMVPQKAEEE